MPPGVDSYSAYQTSGVEWLGDVPTHWEIRRGKALFQSIDVRSHTGREELLTVSAERGVVPRKSASVTMFRAESYVGYKLCWPGDLVINSLWAWAHGLGVSRHHGIVSSAYGVYRLRSKFKSYTRLIHHLVRSIPFQWELQVRSKGIWLSRLQLTDEAFLGAPIPLPPPAEQAAIVRYLDHADDRIRRYISGKERLIALLEEQKQAMIHQAVTRGLAPNVPLKRSGVDWLGDVPEHWEVRRVGHLSKVGNGSTPSRGNAAYWSDGTHPWLNSSSVNQGTITRADQFVTDLALRECHLPRVRSGSVLVGITGQGRTRGMAAVLSMDATINQHVAYVTPTTARVSSNYLHLCLTAAYSELRAISGASGSTKAALTCQDIKRFRVVLPPLSEQAAIARYLDETTATIDTTLAYTRRQIELLREYRTRLIADVVTGKLDVRAAAARLPEAADDQDPIEQGGSLADGLDEEIYDAEEVPTTAGEVRI